MEREAAVVGAAQASPPRDARADVMCAAVASCQEVSRARHLLARGAAVTDDARWRPKQDCDERFYEDSTAFENVTGGCCLKPTPGSPEGRCVSRQSMCDLMRRRLGHPFYQDVASGRRPIITPAHLLESC